MDEFDLSAPIIVRVGTPGGPAFQLRKGEEGLSVFDPAAVDPPLSPAEILDAFREDSTLIVRQVGGVETAGLRVESIEGAATLSERLRLAHREIRPGPGMTRPVFKQALKRLE